MLVPGVWTPQVFWLGGVERGPLVARSGVQRWNTWTGASQGQAHKWIWSLACCSGFPAEGRSYSFLLQSQGTKWWGCSLWWTHSCWCASIQAEFSGQCKWENSWAVGPFQSLSGSQETALRVHGRRRSDTTRQRRWPLGQGRLGHLLSLGGRSLLMFCDRHLRISMCFTPGYKLLREEISWAQLYSSDQALGNFQGCWGSAEF